MSMNNYKFSAAILNAILSFGKTGHFSEVHHRESDSPNFSGKNEILPTLLSQSVHIGHFLTFSTHTIVIKKQFCGSRNFFAPLDMFLPLPKFFSAPEILTWLHFWGYVLEGFPDAVLGW